MSITDELREWKGHIQTRLAPEAVLTLRAELNAIADRIDAEHQKAIRELNNLADASVLLPVDADGEHIHMGDRMENGERVVRIILTDGSWEPTVHTASTPNQLHEYYCHDIRHYQRDTWERIIRDAIGEGMKRELSNHNGGYDRSDSLSNASLVARCKALAGDAE